MDLGKMGETKAAAPVITNTAPAPVTSSRPSAIDVPDPDDAVPDPDEDFPDDDDLDDLDG